MQKFTMKFKHSRIVSAFLVLSIFAAHISPILAEEVAMPIDSALSELSIPTVDQALDGAFSVQTEDVMTEPGVENLDLAPETESTAPMLLTCGISTCKTPETTIDGLLDTNISAVSTSDTGTISITPEATIQTAKATVPTTDSLTGALVYEYPVQVPPGRNGLTPSLNLKYSSQKLENSSVVGHGWEISIPYITRKNTHGTEQLYSRNDYVSSEDGNLVLMSTTGMIMTFYPESQSSNFNQYRLNTSTNTWTLTTKNGTKLTFGDSTASREDDPTQPSHVFRWMLSTVLDANGNSIDYTYTKDQNRIYPSNIHYGIFDIDFVLESRPDALSSFASAFSITTNSRVSSVQIKVSDILKKKYAFSYTAGTNGSRSVLKSIAETAYDVNNISTTLPATIFDYTTLGMNQIFTDQPNTQVPIGNFNLIYQGLGEKKGIITGDVNGDAYPDIIKAYEYISYSYSSDKKIYTYNPANNSFQISTNYTVPADIMNFTAGAHSSWDGGTRLLDINGDTKNDLIRTPYGYSGSKRDKEINNGNGWTQIPENNPKYDVDYLVNPIYPLYSNDLNGDGLVDYIQDSRLHWNGINGSTGELYDTDTSLNNGNGFSYFNTINHAGTDYQAYSYTPDYIGRDRTLMFDINGDGLADIIESSQFSTDRPRTDVRVQKVYINNGTSWELDPSYILPADFVYYFSGEYSWGNQKVMIYDFNNDGLNDILEGRNGLWLNQGKSFLKYKFSNDNSIQELFGRDYMDINADGSLDMHYGGGWYYNNAKTGVDVLKQITLPTGGKVDVTYKSSAQYKDANGNLLNPKLSFPVSTVEKITTTDTVMNVVSTDTFTYSDGYFYFDPSNPFTRRFAGFNKVTKTDSANNKTTTFYHQGNDSNSSQGEYNDSYFKIGRPYRVEIANSAGSILSKSINKWDETDLGSGSKLVKLSQTVESAYDGKPTHRDKAESYIYDNSNGNIIEKTEYGEVLAGDDGNFGDVGGDKFITSYTYANAGSERSQISGQIIVDQNSNKIKESRNYYDKLPFGELSKGNQTKQENWKGDATFVSSQKTYNSQGLVVSDIDPRGKATSYAYDAYDLYPASVTNPLNQATSYVYDYSSGKVTQKTDPNLRVSQYSYDGFGRLLSEKMPDSTSGDLVVKSSYVYTDTANAMSVHKTDNLDSSVAREIYQYYDGLGRLIQHRVETEGDDKYVVVDKVYDSRGLTRKESLPYFAFSSGRANPIPDDSLFTTYTYDSLGRTLTSTNSIGTSVNVYNNWKLTTTDAAGKIKDFYKDSRGNLAQVDEHNAGSIYSTFYTHDYSGSLTKITDALGNIRNFTYDGLGLRLTAEDLHAPSDVTFGVYFYTYDDGGNLVQKIDPNSQTIKYTYDDLGRPLTEDFDGQAGIEATNIYDSGTDGIGHLTQINTGALTQNNTYNPAGGLKSESKVIDSKTYTTSYDYDIQGNQILITNPDLSQVRREYDPAGLLEKIQKKEPNDAGFIDVVSTFEYNPVGFVSKQVNANGTITTSTYDQSKLYRLTNKQTSNTDGVKSQDISYNYDFSGNIINIVDASPAPAGKNVNYVYDDLNRLLSATATNATGQTEYTKTYTYDAIGNILTEDGKTYVYAGVDFANPHAVTRISNGTDIVDYAYDKNGNVLTQGSKLINTWDYNNRLVKSVAGTNTDLYSYDINGQRLTSVRSHAEYPPKPLNPGAITGIQTATSTAFSTLPPINFTGGTFLTNGTIPKVTFAGGASATTSSIPAITFKGGVAGVAASARMLIPADLPANAVDRSITIDGVVINLGTTSQTAIQLAGAITLTNFNSGTNFTTKGSYRATNNGSVLTFTRNNIGVEGNGVLSSSDLTYDGYLSRYKIFHSMTIPPPIFQGGVSAVPAIATITIPSGLPANAPDHSVTIDGVVIDLGVNALTADQVAAAIASNPFVGKNFTVKNPSGANLVFTRINDGTSNVSTNGALTIQDFSYTKTNAIFPTASVVINAPLTANAVDRSIVIDGVVINLGVSALNAEQIASTIANNPFVGKKYTVRNPSGATLVFTKTLDFINGDLTIQDSSYTKTNTVPASATITIQSGLPANAVDRSITIDRVTINLGTGALTPEQVANAIARHPLMPRFYNTKNPSGATLVFGRSTPVANSATSTLAILDGRYGGIAQTVNFTPTSANPGETFRVNINDKEYDYKVKVGDTTTTVTTALASLVDVDPAVACSKNTTMIICTASQTGIAFTFDTKVIPPPPVITTATTTYPSRFYNTDGTVPTKHIFNQDGVVATITGSATSSVVRYIHTDHLGGSSVITNSSGITEEISDYYPFGAIRVDEKTGSFSEQRKYIGQEYDESTGLSYLNARYYDSASGKFISHDPVFWSPEKFLEDPQQLNSYSYARNNPITLSDPTGRWYGEVLTGRQSWGDFMGEVGDATQYMGSGWQTAMDHPYATGMAVGAASGVAFVAAVAAVESGAINLAAKALFNPQAMIRGGINIGFNVATQAMEDKMNGTQTSLGDYAKIAGFSYTSGALFGGKGKAVGIIGAGVSSTVTQKFTGDGEVNPIKTGVSVLTASFGSWAGNYVGKAPNIGTYAAQEYALSKIGWVVEEPISIISSGLNKKK